MFAYQPTSRPAFTLLEVMAALVLTAAAASALIVSLSASDDAARLRRAASLALELDARGRLASRHGVAVELRALNGSGELSLVYAKDGRVLSRHSLQGVSIDFRTGDLGDATVRIRYSLAGTSRDYQLRCWFRGLTRTWEVAGVTGWPTETGRSQR